MATVRLKTLAPRVLLSVCRRHRLHCVRGFSEGPDAAITEFDLIVIGGGSGGLACSKEAASLGKKVAVLDFVKPSTQGTKWGLGGTCVNVGCIPKKLMHQAALLGHGLEDARAYGWDFPNRVTFSWEKMSLGVQNHVRSLNFGYRVQLKDKKVTYFNAHGSLVDANTIKAVNSKNVEMILKAKDILIAVGGRPSLPEEVTGAQEFAITSDDIFWKKKNPGRTLVVGGSYVALECAGFLTGMHLDTTVMIRSIALRGFDQDMSKLVTEHMDSAGTNFLWQCHPNTVEKNGDGKLVVSYTPEGEQVQHDTFDTVLFATGRWPETSSMNLEKIGVKVDEKSGKVVGGHGGDSERSSVPNIYAVGDVLLDTPELTPVAIMAGRMLAQRLYGKAKSHMDYDKVATTVYTPLEFGTVGISEEAALQKYGEDGLEVYHSFYQPLESVLGGRDVSQCYIKVVCERAAPQKVLGIHVIGPNAGEMIQGYAVAMKCDVNFEQLSQTVGVHPTCSEGIVKSSITKRSGMDPTVTGC